MKSPRGVCLWFNGPSGAGKTTVTRELVPMLEALAVGTPVVTTPVAGSSDALFGTEGDVPPGIILEDFEVPGMVRALQELHDDAARVRAMGEAARTRIERNFTREAELDRWEKLLRGAVNART